MRPDVVACSPYIQQFELLGTARRSFVLYYRLREISWLHIKFDAHRTTQEIQATRFSTYDDKLAFFDTMEPHMPERHIQQFGRLQGIPTFRIISPREHRRLASIKFKYIVEHTFRATFWDDTSSYCIDPEHMRRLAMPPFTCNASKIL
ncbi:hypothetical protein M9H77_17652 [Catharanthus roseus]|uniref:Uncharacterized protein n=1 Tax=Catharanthus roseus TaxID=4058 RepID=A0ACC0B574_CATRO|nr:hypothetical protein M9H77_17652 [Catharanthus roseus]